MASNAATCFSHRPESNSGCSPERRNCLAGYFDLEQKTCNPSTTRSARGCHPCLRYVPLPMSPGRTYVSGLDIADLAEPEGFEPSIGLNNPITV